MKTTMAMATTTGTSGVTVAEDFQVLLLLPPLGKKETADAATTPVWSEAGSVARRFLGLRAELEREARWEDRTRGVLWAASWAALALAWL